MKKKLPFELTHREKIFWPDEGYTKGDVFDYYSKMAKYILPYLKDRPENLNRHPNGIKGMSFFQKDVPEHPSWIKTKTIHSDAAKKDVHYIISNDLESLLYMIQLGCIEINPWSSRLQTLDKPDFMIIDLDPEDVRSYDEVVEVALAVKKVFDRIGIKSYPKTTGARGMHIYVPLGAKYTYKEVREFAYEFVKVVNKMKSDITSIERRPAKRQGKVYLDYLQNGRGQTLAAPYSLRPKAGATVSTPLKWSEVKKGLDPKRFTIKTIFQRIKSHGDLWKPVLGTGADLRSGLKKLRDII